MKGGAQINYYFSGFILNQNTEEMIPTSSAGTFRQSDTTTLIKGPVSQGASFSSYANSVPDSTTISHCEVRHKVADDEKVRRTSEERNQSQCSANILSVILADRQLLDAMVSYIDVISLTSLSWTCVKLRDELLEIKIDFLSPVFYRLKRCGLYELLQDIMYTKRNHNDTNGISLVENSNISIYVVGSFLLGALTNSTWISEVCSLHIFTGLPLEDTDRVCQLVTSVICNGDNYCVVPDAQRGPYARMKSCTTLCFTSATTQPVVDGDAGSTSHYNNDKVQRLEICMHPYSIQNTEQLYYGASFEFLKIAYQVPSTMLSRRAGLQIQSLAHVVEKAAIYEVVPPHMLHNNMENKLQDIEYGYSTSSTYVDRGYDIQYYDPLISIPGARSRQYIPCLRYHLNPLVKRFGFANCLEFDWFLNDSGSRLVGSLLDSTMFPVFNSTSSSSSSSSDDDSSYNHISSNMELLTSGGDTQSGSVIRTIHLLESMGYVKNLLAAEVTLRLKMKLNYYMSRGTQSIISINLDIPDEAYLRCNNVSLKWYNQYAVPLAAPELRFERRFRPRGASPLIGPQDYCATSSTATGVLANNNRHNIYNWSKNRNQRHNGRGGHYDEDSSERDETSLVIRSSAGHEHMAAIDKLGCCTIV